MLQFSPELSSRLDLALHAPFASTNDYEALFAGALKLGARAVCVPTSRVSLACARLEDSPVKIVGLTGFPLGNADTDVKRFEAEVAVDNGAQEIEMVLNHANLKEGQGARILREFRDLVESVDERPVIVAAEFSRLTDSDIIQLCHLSMDAGVSGLSTGTGFGSAQPTSMEWIDLVRRATSPKFIIKVCPVHDDAHANAISKGGADRLGITFATGDGQTSAVR